ncbi:MAG: MptD family putative ECF transporter S component [Oscillospiraceae bacterium]|nr:MptD family putative ECF transporter S component [Oscillospiraceae bacterium]
MKNENKIKGKDLINIGIYAAIYCVIMTCIAMLGYIPMMMPMLSVLCPLIGGIPMMLFYTKTKKFGMITIMEIIIGIYLCLTGMGVWPIVFSVVFGFLADLVAKSGEYKSFTKTVLSYGVMCLMIFGNYLPLFIDREGYFASREKFGQEYVDTLGGIMQNRMIPVLIIASFVFGVLGALLGKTLLKKHFVKAGIV